MFLYFIVNLLQKQNSQRRPTALNSLSGTERTQFRQNHWYWEWSEMLPSRGKIVLSLSFKREDLQYIL